MLNKDGNRELAYVARITEIVPIEGADRVEVAKIQGWTCMVPKGAFQQGDLGVFFEADSKLPAAAPFEFLEKKNYKVKVQKYFKGTVVSDGLLMPANDFGWTHYQDGDGQYYIHDNEKNISMPEGYFLTQRLGVTYADAFDNKRKAASADKYKKMAQRHGKLFSKQPFRWLMKRTWGKKLLFIFFGKKRDKRTWPAWVVKTDEERVQNLAHMLEEYNKMKWIATEKIDGTSTTFTIKRKTIGYDFFVCSRNVVFDKPDKNCYYDTNVYLEMAEKYDIENKLAAILKERKELDFITIQAETYGDGIQKRDYSIKEHDMAIFNLIFGFKDGTRERMNPYVMEQMVHEMDLPAVPVIGEVVIPTTCEEVLAMANGKSKIDGGMREGLVFRTTDGNMSFKAVDNEFIMKYHK